MTEIISWRKPVSASANNENENICVSANNQYTIA